MTKEHDDDPTYRTWRGMKARCDNPSVKSYDRYGGKGITYDPRWKTYSNFLANMGPKPKNDSTISIERIDNSKGYFPENCCWATHTEQMNNRGVFSNNKSGVTGVSWHKKYHRWYASGQVRGRQLCLYSGYDFFEACCARKSFEALKHKENNFV